MRWQGRRGSGNVEDRRGRAGPAMVGGGLGGLGLVVLVIYALLGGDPLALIQQMPDAGLSGGPERGVALDDTADAAARFVSVVLADTEDVWRELFAAAGETYREPRLVLFEGQVQSACGRQDAAVGPFYCPGDETVYIDLSFYRVLRERFGAAGDFAQAYVIAHEVGHHVQNLLGITGQMEQAGRGGGQRAANDLSVRLELQADFLAGVWAHHAQRRFDILEPGDIEEALAAANAIGDDNLQHRSQGRIVPDTFTHGTGEQRSRWFRLGFETGDIDRGDTFGAGRL